MIHDVVSSVATIWPRLALLLFLLLFAGIVLWTVRGGRERFRDVSRLPLDEHDPVGDSSDTPRIQR
jgi:hypothetical protein